MLKLFKKVKHLSIFGNKIKIVYLEKRVKHKHILGFYNNKDKIYIFAQNDEVFLHELLHAIFLNSLKKNVRDLGRNEDFIGSLAKILIKNLNNITERSVNSKNGND